MILKGDIKDIYGLAPMQEGMLFHYAMEPESTQYIEQAVFEVKGRFEQHIFEKAFDLVIQKHDVLRSIFIFGKGNRPLQGVLHKRKGDIFFDSIKDLSAEEKEAHLNEFCINDRKRGFHLKKDSLMRISVLELEPERYKIIWTFHHIIMDGWCLGIIMGDFFSNYDKLIHNIPVETVKTIQYSEYIKWLKTKDSKKALDYWKQYINGYDTSVSLPSDRHESVNKYEMGIHEFELSKNINDQLTFITNNNKITMSSVFQTLWGLLLSKYNDVNDIIFGTVVSGRPADIENVESIVGLFINTIPTRIKYDRTESFIKVVENVQKQFVQSTDYGYVSLSEIQASGDIKRDLVNNIVVYENYPIDKMGKDLVNKIGFDIAGDIEFTEQTNYDLEFTILPSDQITLRIKYNKNMYSDLAINKLGQHITDFIDAFISNPNCRIDELKLLSKEEEHKIIYEFNKQVTEETSVKAIHELVEEQVIKSCDDIAIVDKDGELTYRQLNAKSNRLARLLQNAYNIKKGDCIGISLDRKKDTIVSILAVLKLGAVCIPIDSKYPVKRIEDIVISSKIKLVLTEKEEFGIGTIDNINLNAAKLNTENYEDSNLNIRCNSEDLAYIIFTSGSTGKSKGVMITHGGIVNHAFTKIRETNMVSSDLCCHSLNFSFVASIWLIFSPLFTGCSLHLYDEETILDANKLFRSIERDKISILETVPSVLKAYLDLSETVLKDSKLQTLRKIILTGEKVDSSLVNTFYKTNKIELINAYGQSECSDDTLHYHIPNSCQHKNIPIGKPSLNTQVYIMDKSMNLQPVGVAGEICIAGACLSKGYLDNLELTAEKFIDNPLFPGTLLFRTGDLGCWLPDGNIEYIGRIDYQVKVRGFRIELEEIEHILIKSINLSVAVIAKQDEKGLNYLCAYIESESELDLSKIKDSLASELPDYMIPSYFTLLDKLPLNQNGKVDRKKLAELDVEIQINKAVYEPPINQTEMKLIGIWKELLAVDVIGRNDNFFELGGHSLKGMALIAKINKEFNVEIPLKSIFEMPTVKEISTMISDSKHTAAQSIEQASKAESYPVSSAQKRMYLLQNFDKESTSYNMPWAVEINGYLDTDRLKKAFVKLIERQESLRTYFCMEEEHIVQKVNPDPAFDMACKEINSDESVDEIVDDFIKPFHLEQSQLFRAKLVKIDLDRYILILDMHHIISDGMSMDILFKELLTLYQGKEPDELKIQYKDYAVWQNKQLESNKMQEEKQYWMEQFKDEIPILNIPTDYVRPKVQEFDGDKVEFILEEEETLLLNQLASRTGSTLFMVLLSGIKVLLSKYSGQEDIIIGTPILGRTREELQNLVGMFVNTLAIRSKQKGGQTFEEFLCSVRDNCIQAYDNGNYQFEQLVEELNIYKDAGRNALFDVMFSMENAIDEQTQLEGLQFKKYKRTQTTAKFDLTFSGMEYNKKLYLEIEYSKSLFKKDTIKKMAVYLQRLLKAVAEKADCKLSEIDLLDQIERQEILYRFNEMQPPIENSLTVMEMFEKQVKDMPEYPALAWGEHSLTYRELNEQVNQTARYFRTRKIEKNDIAAVMMDHSPQLVISILALMKLGVTYLPIEPDYPLERVKYIVETCDLNKIIIQDSAKRIQLPTQIEFVEFPDFKYIQEEKENLNEVIEPESLAYIIFTSGSTGNPKGVMISQGSLLNYLSWGAEYYVKGEKLNFPLYSSISFDLTVTSFFLPLITGNTMIIYNAKEKSTLIEQILTDNCTDIIKLTPSHLELMAEYGYENTRIRKIIVGGELLKKVTADRIYEMFGQSVEIYNEYGPTEATVGCMIQKYSPMDKEGISVPIGVPIANTQIYVLDKYKKPVVKGAIGEIYIAGKGLAEGYINDSVQTSEKFLLNPFSANLKMYKTGDLARILESGIIEYIGRVDEQVKLRGYRIEIGEIETKIKNNHQVMDAVVTLLKDKVDQGYLCAYITGKSKIDIHELREELYKELPRYMVPSYFVQLDKIPMTKNGKADLRNLPEPDGRDLMTSYEEPTNQTEEKLALIWKDILALDKVGITDNFFEIGGQSLKATQLVSRINDWFEIKLSLRNIFEYQTIKELGQYMEQQKKTKYSGLNHVEESDDYEVSSAQKRMYILQMLDRESINYNIPRIFLIEGMVDKDKLEQSFLQLQERHEILRTSFYRFEDTVRQKINPKSNLVVEYGEVASEQGIETLFEEFVQPFELERDTLFRVKLIHTGTDKSFLFFDIHHIISDAVSTDILIREFIQYYQGEELTQVTFQYKDYSAWQKEQLVSETMINQKKYWKNKMSGELPILNLITDYERPAVWQTEADSVTLVLHSEFTNKLRQISQQTGTTMFMIFLSGIQIVLSKYADQEDIIIGTPIAGRNKKELEDIVGLFVNTLPIRNYPIAEKTYREFLYEVKETSLEAFDNQDYQFDDLIEDMNIPRETGRNPLFDVMLSMTEQEESSYSLENMKISNYRGVNHEEAKFDLTFFVSEEKETVEISLQYCKKLFMQETVTQLLHHLENVLGNICENMDQPLGKINMISEEEKKKVLSFNPQEILFSENTSITKLFEEQVGRVPHNKAVVFDDKFLTYSQLDTQSSCLANILSKKNVSAGDIVGIIADSSMEMIVAILAILKLNAAYLPIDPLYPEDWINSALDDCNTSVVFCESQYLHLVSDKYEVIELNTLNLSEIIDTKLDEDKQFEIKSNDLAYVMFTSGTTGKPKGIMIEHKSVIRLVKDTNYVSFDQNDRVVQTGTFAFDASTFEIWGTLLNGLELHLRRKAQILDLPDLCKYMINNKISIIWMTSGLFNLASQVKPEMFRNLKMLMVGGEALSAHYINLLKDKYPELNIYNLYGPTENTTFSTYFKIDKKYEKNIPIGKPISNSKAYILSKDGVIQPLGICGEIHLAGAGLARGYVNNTELTREKFVNLPSVTEERLYKTGDLGRWLPDGSIEYLGRIDKQVKIRGFRIELEKIESEIVKIDVVKEAVVIDKKDDKGIKFLCSYVVSDTVLKVQELKDKLSRVLPEYMVPSHFVQLDAIPLNNNGKVDKNKLLKLKVDILTNTEYEQPRNALEEKLIAIWSEILEVKEIGINSNFFELGGHSLKAITLQLKINELLHTEIPLSQIFAVPTVKGIAEYIADATQVAYIPIQKVEEREYYDLSSAQKRMYLLQEFEKQSTKYNMPQVFKIDGKIDQVKLESVLNKLIMGQEQLRTSFHMVEDEMVQKIHSDIEFKLEVQKCVREADMSNLVMHSIKPFDLANAPLFRAKLFRTEEGTDFLMLDMHHIISDGISMSILFQNILTLYEGRELAVLPAQYKDFVYWEKMMFQSKRIQESRDYWINQFSGTDFVLDIPTDYIRPSIQSFEGDIIDFTIDENTTIALKQLAKKTDSTMFMVLLSSITVLLSKYGGTNELVIGTTIAGRPRIELHNIVGMFVNTLAIKNKIDDELNYEEFLAKVKENCIQAFENGDYPFDELVDELNLHRDISRNPIFDVMFTMNEEIKADKKIDGLTLTEFDLSEKTSKFDLTFSAVEYDKTIIMSMEYCTKLYKKETIMRMICNFKHLLKIIVKNVDSKIKDMDIVNPVEKELILNKFNKAFTEYNKEKTIQQIFEMQASIIPDQLAVVYEGTSLTYRQLNEKSNQVAVKLRESGIGREDMVGILLDKSLELMVAIMGVLKAGGAYLPIDHDHPEHRKKYLIEDSGMSVLLSKKHLVNGLDASVPIIDINEPSIYNNSCENVTSWNEPTDLAYIIYTSGSTGNPKGIMVEHRNVLHVSNWYNNKYDVKSNKNTLQITNMGFDVAVLETLVVVMNGGIIYIPKKEDIYDRDKFRNYVNTHKIESVQFVPETLKQLVIGNEKMDSLSVLISGGDILEGSTVQEILNMGYKIYNHYGPTETTVDTIATQCGEQNIIGKPVENSYAYIMDKENRILPIGVHGEICIGGDGVTRGYLGNEALTNKVFIPNPYNPEQRIYKTGDMGKWLPDGNIQFLGRIDSQVKIRGIRIELGEIENVLLKHESIQDVAVIARKDDGMDKYLCAYIVAQIKFTVDMLRDYLHEKLPDYMIPNVMVQMDGFLLNSNGKVDKKALPKPDTSNMARREIELPTNETEQKIAEVWSEILNIEIIGIEEDFFELGGHSLKASTIISRLNRIFQVEIPLMEVFRHTTIKKMAQYIQNAKVKDQNVIYRAKRKDYYRLSHAQKRIFITHELNKQDVSYNMPILLKVTGNIDIGKLEEIIQKIGNRHEVLRTSIQVIDGEAVQVIHDLSEITIESQYFDGENLQEKMKQCIVPFDLEKAPLLRVKHFISESGQYLFMDMHHIISDGFSIDILAHEILTLYNGGELQELAIQYKDYAEWQYSETNQLKIKKLEHYWMDKIKGFELTRIEGNYAFASNEGGEVEIRLDEQLTKQIAQLCRKLSVSRFSFYNGILNMILMNETGSDDITIGTPIAGRNQELLEPIIGLFLNLVLLRMKIDKNSTFREYLQNVNETIMEAMDNQEYPYEELYSLVREKMGSHIDSLFSVMINYVPYTEELAKENESLQDLMFDYYETEQITSKYDITVYINEGKDDVSISIVYKKNVYEPYIIERIAEAFEGIARIIIENEDMTVKELDYSTLSDSDDEMDELDLYYDSLQ